MRVQERVKAGEVMFCFVDFSKVRIQGVPRNTWHGEALSRIRTISTVESVGSGEGTTMQSLQHATADNLTNLNFTVPPSDCFISEFRHLRHKLKAPFRLTVRAGLTI